MNQALRVVSLWLSLVLISALSHAEETEFLPADQAFSYEHEFINGQLTIKFDIADHYCLYLSKISIKQEDKTLSLSPSKQRLKGI